MAEKNLIKQIKVEGIIYDLGGSIYDMEETNILVDNDNNITKYLVFYCGTATELID